MLSGVYFVFFLVLRLKKNGKAVSFMGKSKKDDQI